MVQVSWPVEQPSEIRGNVLGVGELGLESLDVVRAIDVPEDPDRGVGESHRVSQFRKGEGAQRRIGPGIMDHDLGRVHGIRGHHLEPTTAVAHHRSATAGQVIG